MLVIRKFSQHDNINLSISLYLCLTFRETTEWLSTLKENGGLVSLVSQSNIENEVNDFNISDHLNNEIILPEKWDGKTSLRVLREII